MAHHTLIARINAGNGKFPFVNVQFSKNHRPIPIKGATYYLRPSNCGKRTPIRIGKDVAVAHTALINLDSGRLPECPTAVESHPPSVVEGISPRKTVEEAAREYIERSKQKSRKTYLGYRTAVNLFVASCLRSLRRPASNPECSVELSRTRNEVVHWSTPIARTNAQKVATLKP